MNDTITKALSAASQVLKGETPAGVTAAQLESTLLSLGDIRKGAGETQEACFTRLIRESDADAVLLSKALDALRYAESLPDAERTANKGYLVGQATELLDEHVEKSRRINENTAQATARLAAEGDATFSRLYQHLRDAQNIGAGLG